MFKRQAMVRGTLLLTAAGFASRLLGFFYRIFLSHCFGEEQIGLYQLLFPVYGIAFSLATSGIETALVRGIAAKISIGQKKEAHHFLLTGICLSVFFSCICTFLLQRHAFFLARLFLGDDRCAPLLSLLSWVFPFTAIHACVSGYYYGQKQVGVPILSQLVEQLSRISLVFLLFWFLKGSSHTPSIALAVLGLGLGEVCAAGYVLLKIPVPHESRTNFHSTLRQGILYGKEILTISLPLTVNRVFVNLLQGMEAVSIPKHLRLAHYSPQKALCLYGVLQGMALPCILFPTALSAALALLLTPAIAQMQATGRAREMAHTVQKVTGLCFAFGCACCLFFLLTGRLIGSRFFHSTAAGDFILTLAWICPFLYANNALTSILNGLGKTNRTLTVTLAGLTIRMVSVFLWIPPFGIQGYLWGLLLSQCLVSLLSCFFVRRQIHLQES